VIGDPAEGAKLLEMWAKEWPEMARYAGVRKVATASYTSEDEPMTSVKPGKVVSYDRGRGGVELFDAQRVEFGVTSFHSGRPTRLARVGDEVEVVFSGTTQDAKSLLYVRLARKKPSDVS